MDRKMLTITRHIIWLCAPSVCSRQIFYLFTLRRYITNACLEKKEQVKYRITTKAGMELREYIRDHSV